MLFGVDATVGPILCLCAFVAKKDKKIK